MMYILWVIVMAAAILVEAASFALLSIWFAAGALAALIAAMLGAEDKEVRITLDSNIRSRFYDLDLAKGDYGERLLPEGTYLMEIKVAGAMPLWLAHILSDLDIKPVSFSKYGSVYKRKIAESKRIELVKNEIPFAV